MQAVAVSHRHRKVADIGVRGGRPSHARGAIASTPRGAPLGCWPRSLLNRLQKVHSSCAGTDGVPRAPLSIKQIVLKAHHCDGECALCFVGDGTVRNAMGSQTHAASH